MTKNGRQHRLSLPAALSALAMLTLLLTLGVPAEAQQDEDSIFHLLTFQTTGEMRLGKNTQVGDGVQHTVVGETITDMLAFALRLHQSRSFELLQVLGGVGHGEARHLRQLFHVALALGQKIQDLQAHCAAQGACHHRQLLEQGLFRFLST